VSEGTGWELLGKLHLNLHGKKKLSLFWNYLKLFFAFCFCLEEAGHQVCNKSAITVKKPF